MIISVKLFAVLKESLGEVVEIEVPEPVTVHQLLNRFGEDNPQFQAALPSLRVAVDQSYANGDEPILAGQEVAIIPPVSGG